jgi:hypothetical protein
MGIIDQIIKEAQDELLLDPVEKNANDQNGGPTESAQQQGGGDILASAQAHLANVEKFKASLGQMAAGAGGDQPPGGGAPGEEAAEGETPGAGAEAGGGAVVIARPDGTQIKVAALMKLAALRGKRLFAEVK